MRLNYRKKVIYGSLAAYALGGIVVFLIKPALGDLRNNQLNFLADWWAVGLAQALLSAVVGILIALYQWARGVGRPPVSAEPARATPWFIVTGLLLLIGNSLCLGLIELQ